MDMSRKKTEKTAGVNPVVTQLEEQELLKRKKSGLKAGFTRHEAGGVE
jgi:hypothetical protein